MSDPRNPEAKFRSNVLEAISRIGDTVNGRLNGNESAIAANTEMIGELGAKIDRLTSSIEAQTQNIGRLERGISQMVAESQAQRETVNNLIKLATALVQQRAS